MHACRVLSALDISKHAVPGLSAGGKVLPVGFFDFQRVPEAQQPRVCLRVFPAHAGDRMMIILRVAGVLPTAHAVVFKGRAVPEEATAAGVARRLRKHAVLAARHLKFTHGETRDAHASLRCRNSGASCSRSSSPGAVPMANCPAGITTSSGQFAQ